MNNFYKHITKMITAVVKNKRRAYVHESTSEVLSQKVAAYLRQYGSNDLQIKRHYKAANKPLKCDWHTLRKVVHYEKYHVQKSTIENLMCFFGLEIDKDFFQNWGVYKHIENEG